jgi:hypothetical protein
MAGSHARLNRRQADTCRQAIQTTYLINRLHKHIEGEVELTMAQIRAAEILLKKSLPDLSAVELSGDPDNPVSVSTVERLIVDAKTTDTNG